MSVNLGRNNPCHCGSGNKYKKCCLAKDEKNRHAEDAELAAPAIEPPLNTAHHTPKAAPDPRIEAGNARWSEFESSDYDRRLLLFLQTLDDPELMDGDMAFDMLDQVFRETAEHGERNRFDALVERLSEHRPDIYAEEEAYFLKWRITNALVAGRSEDVSTLALKLAPLAGKDIDIFNRAANQIAYYGHLPALVDAMRLAWPEVKSSNKIVPWGIDEFCTRAMTFELLNYAEHTAGAAEANLALLKQLKFYSAIDVERVAAYFAHLTGGIGQLWAMSDFNFVPLRRSREEEKEEESATAQQIGELNLYHLTVEFLGYLQRREGVPYAKGELGRFELHQFILDRLDGKLEYRESMLESMQRNLDREQGRRSPPKRRFRPYNNVLVPDPERLECFLAGLLDMMNQLNHRAAAMFQIIPAWLRFLETRRLIDTEARVQTLRDLERLVKNLIQIFKSSIDDTGPLRALEGWIADSKKTMPKPL